MVEGCPRDRQETQSRPNGAKQVEGHPKESRKSHNYIHINNIYANSQFTAIPRPARMACCLYGIPSRPRQACSIKSYSSMVVRGVYQSEGPSTRLPPPKCKSVAWRQRQLSMYRSGKAKSLVVSRSNTPQHSSIGTWKGQWAIGNRQQQNDIIYKSVRS